MTTGHMLGVLVGSGVMAFVVLAARGLGVPVSFTNGEVLILGGLMGLAWALRGGR